MRPKTCKELNEYLAAQGIAHRVGRSDNMGRYFYITDPTATDPLATFRVLDLRNALSHHSYEDWLNSVNSAIR